MSKLSDIRAMLKMSQESFAEFCDISRISVARYEAGAPMSRSNAQKIARACGISIDELLNEDSGNTSPVVLLKEQSSGLSKEEQDLLDAYRTMTPYGRQRAQETLHELQIVYPDSDADS